MKAITTDSKGDETTMHRLDIPDETNFKKEVDQFPIANKAMSNSAFDKYTVWLLRIYTINFDPFPTLIRVQHSNNNQ